MKLFYKINEDLRMITRGLIALVAIGACALSAMASPGPVASMVVPSQVVPQDRPYPGLITLSVDASDVSRRIVHVHEVISGVTPGMALLYPKWLPGTHSPEGPIDRVAGFRFQVDGKRVSWSRDPLDTYALHVEVGKRVATVEVDFDYLSPTSGKVGSQEISRAILELEWNALALYPEGYYTRQIPVDVAVTVPKGWVLGTALEADAEQGSTTRFKRTTFETLVDSPLYAGLHTRRIDLDPNGVAPVYLDLFADKPEDLVTKEEQLGVHRALVQQAYKLYGAHHYAHYVFLLSLSDAVREHGLEHHQSSEDGVSASYFTEWDKNAESRDLLPHEFTHSWNGKFRRPADLWTPNYSVPMQNSLLWVYEGQTQYWGQVLAARSGLWSVEQARDSLALTAAYYDNQVGRQWRALVDTTNDEIINPRRPQSWPSYQRFEDYYSEGQLIWLEADTLIRERSKGARSLDDFAQGFFGINNGSFVPVTYTFGDLVKALNRVEPYDWATYLHTRVDQAQVPAPLAGLQRGGYQLVYTSEPNAFLKDSDAVRKQATFSYSLGCVLSEGGYIEDVTWGSPAFKAALTESMTVLSVNQEAYTPELLSAAITRAATDHQPIQLIVRSRDHFEVVAVPYYGGLRYPHLQRIESVPAYLDDILRAKP